jgi:hypothetical protein
MKTSDHIMKIEGNADSIFNSLNKKIGQKYIPTIILRKE